MSTSAATRENGKVTKVDGANYSHIREGRACILTSSSTAPSFPEPEPEPRKKDRGYKENYQTVFYNPVQQFNRDLSVLAILTYGEAALPQKTAKYQKKHKALRKQREVRKKKTAIVAAVDETDRKEDGIDKKRKRTESMADEVLGDNATTAEEVLSKRLKTDGGENDQYQKETEAVSGEDGNLACPEPDQQENTTAQSGDQNVEPKQNVAHFNILDALSATGLRAIRYAKEIPFVTKVIANDMSRSAVKSIEKNIDYNELRGKVCSNVDDARAYMYSKVGNDPDWASGRSIHRFDVIDLDPYGTAAPFFDAALQALQDGGLLCVTCTDAAVFASHGYPEKTYALYGGIPMKGAHSHEGGLRLVLHAIAKSAATYGIAIEPLLSLSIDFYARLFVRVHKQAKDVKTLAGTTMTVYSCDYGCGAWRTQPLARNIARESRNGEAYFKHSYAQGPTATSLCEHCGSKTHLSGPMWAGPLHNPYFIQRILDRLPSLDLEVYGTISRIEGMLTVALQEDLDLDQKAVSPVASLPPAIDPHQASRDVPPISRLPPASLDPAPFFFIQNYLAKVLHCQTPSEEMMRGALRHLGYRATRSHCKAGSIKTDAPWSVIWEIMREYVRTKEPNKGRITGKGTAGWGILARMRGSERAQLKELHEEVEQMLSKSSSVAEARTVLEAALFRLGRKTSNSIEGGETQTETETVVQKGSLSMNGQQQAKNNNNKNSTYEVRRSSSDAIVDNMNEEEEKEEKEEDLKKPPPPPQQEATTTTTTTTTTATIIKQKHTQTLRPQDLHIVFDERLGREEKPSGKKRLCRYQLNPRPNWGPMNRAGGS